MRCPPAGRSCIRRWRAIALVPLCPHTLSNRPIVVSDACVHRGANCSSPHDARVHFDGQTRFDAAAPAIIVRIAPLQPRRSPCCIRIGYSYFAMLREKLRWSETPRPH
ncbi:MAG: hypothetical protein MZW92_79400 [Comamonadaceae bacterium]|nr:hypothetical protein [Comamonadaceae bacterium]